MRTFPILVLLLTLACHGCVNRFGESVLTGKARPAISPSAVKIYSEKPPESQDIGIVRAYSVGWTTSGASQTLTTNLIMEAAKLGADGLLIKNFMVKAGEHSNADGIAFHVPEKKD